jgi:urease accessory protein
MTSGQDTNTDPPRPRRRKAATPAAASAPPPASGQNTVAWLPGLLQAVDSFYPTGSYAHSFGLEGLVQEGVVRDRESLRAFIFQSALPALRRTELPLTTHAWRAFGEPDWETIGRLCVLSSALKAPREARLASENIGRQRADLVARLHDAPLAHEYCRRAAANSWPGATAVSAALEGRVLGAPIDAVLSAALYSGIAALLAAGMKLLRLGQNGAQSLLAEALRVAPETIAGAQSVAEDEIGWFNPWLDIAAARHEGAASRMFVS